MKTFQSIFKTLLVLLPMGTFLLCVMPFFAQSLEGKWNIAKIDTRHSTVIQFTKDSLIFYDFDERQSATSYQVKDNRIAVDSGSIPIGGEFLFLNPQRLRLIPDRAKNPIDFVRFQPTQTTLTSAEIEKLNFEINYQNKILPINFNQVEDESGKSVRLETIDSTYFLSFYRNDKRMGAMPIERVTSKNIMVYGFPEEPFMVTGERVKSHKNPARINSASSSIGKLTTSEAIIGKWFYKCIQGRPSLSDCTKKTFFQFTEDLSLQTKPYAEKYSNGNCVPGSLIIGTYEVIDDDQIKVTQNGATSIWKIQSLTKTKLVVERDSQVLTLTKE